MAFSHLHQHTQITSDKMFFETFKHLKMFNQSTIVFIRGRRWYRLILSMISKISNFAICRPKHGAKARIGLWLERFIKSFGWTAQCDWRFDNMSESQLYSEGDLRTCCRNVNHQQSSFVLYPAKSFHFRKKGFAWLFIMVNTVMLKNHRLADDVVTWSGLRRFDVGTLLVFFRRWRTTCNASSYDPGGTLGISGWGCADGTLEPLAYNRASSGEFCYPIRE